VKLLTEKGKANCQKIDIFKGVMWFSYENEGMHWHELKVDRVNEIVAINKKGKKPASIEEFIEDTIVPDKELFNNVVGQDSLTRFDQPKRRRKKRRNKNRNRNRNQKRNA
ncbi:MAG: hypothetical protein HKN48_03525, partial [Flavobacteriaceae bacterium]|nr:hypothetical protein [Flavobacteriaceae bacterium]